MGAGVGDGTGQGVQRPLPHARARPLAPILLPQLLSSLAPPPDRKKLHLITATSKPRPNRYFPTPDRRRQTLVDAAAAYSIFTSGVFFAAGPPFFGRDVLVVLLDVLAGYFAVGVAFDLVRVDVCGGCAYVCGWIDWFMHVCSLCGGWACAPACPRRSPANNPHPLPLSLAWLFLYAHRCSCNAPRAGDADCDPRQHRQGRHLDRLVLRRPQGRRRHRRRRRRRGRRADRPGGARQGRRRRRRAARRGGARRHRENARGGAGGGRRQQRRWRRRRQVDAGQPVRVPAAAPRRVARRLRAGGRRHDRGRGGGRRAALCRVWCAL